MGDAVAEEVYLAVNDARHAPDHPTEVHIFPCRMNAENWQDLLFPLTVGRPEMLKLWDSLRAGYERFERLRQVPVVRVDERGCYQVE